MSLLHHEIGKKALLKVWHSVFTFHISCEL